MTAVPRDQFADSSRDGSGRLLKASEPGFLADMDIDTLVEDNDRDDNSPWIVNED